MVQRQREAGPIDSPSRGDRRARARGDPDPPSRDASVDDDRLLPVVEQSDDSPIAAAGERVTADPGEPVVADRREIALEDLVGGASAAPRRRGCG